MMPKKNGFDVCADIRENDRDTPILLLSAKGDIVDKSIGFKAGADDYVTKPFVKEELLLRIEALLRRSTKGDRSSPRGARAIARVGDLEIQFKRHLVLLKGKPVELTPKEFRILALMANRPGEVFTTREIVEHVWGEDYIGELTSVAVFVRKIREKIEEDPSKPCYLITVWRVGYRLGDPKVQADELTER
jgi:two-component system response regulator VicR